MEISQAYRYCPICSAPRALAHAQRPFQCQACNHTSFFGPVAAVGGVVTDETGRVLLIERARDPGKGLLGMPGGFVDPYESAEEALRRETREELGLEIQDFRFLMTASNTYVYNGVSYPVLDVYFQATTSANQTIQPEASEVANWIWALLSVEVLDRMAFQSNRRALECYLASLSH